MPQRSNPFKSHWSNQWLTLCAVISRLVTLRGWILLDIGDFHDRLVKWSFGPRLKRLSDGWKSRQWIDI